MKLTRFRLDRSTRGGALARRIAIFTLLLGAFPLLEGCTLAVVGAGVAGKLVGGLALLMCATFALWMVWFSRL